MVLVGDSGVLAASALQDIGNLRLFFEVEDGMEDRMFDGQVHRFILGLREDLFDLLMKSEPVSISPEIVTHEEAAVQQIFPQDGNLLRLESEPARFDDVDKGIIVELLVREIDVAAVRVDLERRDLLESEREIQVA